MRLLLQQSPLPQARELKELPYFQTGEGREMVLGWSSHAWKAPRQLHVLTAQEFKAQAAAGRKLYSGKGVGKEEEESVCGMTQVSMTVCNLCFYSLQTYKQGAHLSEQSRDSQNLKISTIKCHLWLHCYREGLLCLELSSCSYSYPVSQIPDE